MDCSTAEGLVSRYISHTLAGQELEEFLEHIRTCPSCYDELETYFIVNEATRHLSQEDSESDLDFQEILKQDIRKKQHELIREKIKKSVYGTAFFLGGIAGLSGIIYLIVEFAKQM